MSRYVISDVMAKPSRFLDWWVEWPFRRNVMRWAYWRWLLLDAGQGWLRWGADTREHWSGYCLDPPEPYVVWPPSRRVFSVVRYRARWPLAMREIERREHRAW